MINDGVIVDHGRPEEVITGENVEKVYGVRARTVKVDGARLILPSVEHVTLIHSRGAHTIPRALHTS